jgi:hypothetical protein
MRTETIPAAAGPRPRSRGRRGRGARRGALAGLLACGAALGTAELLAGIVGGQSSPLVAVGGAAIDATPEWLKEFAIRSFGERDKLALLAGIAVVLAGFAVTVGLLAVRRPASAWPGWPCSAPPARPPPSPVRAPASPTPSRPWPGRWPGRPRCWHWSQLRGRPSATRLRARAPGGGA